MNLSESSKLPLVTCKNRFSVCPFVSLFSCPFVHSFICPFNICPSVGLSSCLLGHLSNCPPLPACLLSVYRFVICLFVLSVCPTAGKLICLCLFICLFAQFYFYLFVCLFICMSVFLAIIHIYVLHLYVFVLIFPQSWTNFCWFFWHILQVF